MLGPLLPLLLTCSLAAPIPEPKALWTAPLGLEAILLRTALPTDAPREGGVLLTADGSSVLLGASIFAEPGDAERSVLVQRLDAATGRVEWSWMRAAGSMCQGDMNSVLLLSADEETLFLVAATGQSTDDFVVALAAHTGEVLWSRTMNGPAFNVWCCSAYLQNALPALTARGDLCTYTECLDGSTGAVLFPLDPAAPSLSNWGLDPSLAVVVSISVTSGPATPYFAAYDALTGTLVSQGHLPTGASPTQAAAVSSTAIFVITEGSGGAGPFALYGFSLLTGAPLPAFPVAASGGTYKIVVTSVGLLSASFGAAEGFELALLDAKTGAERWVAHRPQMGTLRYDFFAFVMTAGGSGVAVGGTCQPQPCTSGASLEVLSTKTGQVMATAAAPPSLTVLAPQASYAGGGVLAVGRTYVNATTTLYSAWATLPEGGLAWGMPPAGPSEPSLTVLAAAMGRALFLVTPTAASPVNVTIAGFAVPT